MASKFTMETPFDVAPDSSSTYDIYPPDDMWLVGNGTDQTLKYDLEYIEPLEGGAPKGNILIVYKGRLMIAGNNDFPHRIFFSHFHNGEGWTIETDWLDVYPEDGGVINSLCIVNDELIISKGNSRKYGWRIYDDANPVNSKLRIIETDKGDMNSRTSTVLNDVNYYLDWEGMFSVPRLDARGNVSYPINEVFDAVEPTYRTNIAMGSNDSKVYTSIGDVTFDADKDVTVTGATAVYDANNQAFYLRDHLNGRVYTRFIDSNDRENLYFGNDENKVFKLDSGTLAGLDTITMMIDTKAYFKEMERNVVVESIGVRMKNPDNTMVLARTISEQDFVVQIGEVTKEPIQWFNVEEYVGEVPFLQLRFIHQGTAVRPALLGFIILYREAGRKDDK